MTLRLLPFLLLGLHSAAFAHSSDTIMPGTDVDIALSATWRNQGTVPANTLWQIPGIMTGGHALPLEKGLSLDEASLAVTHRRPDGIYGLLKAESHGHDAGFNLEHAYVGYQHQDSMRWLQIEAGRMSAAFSPANLEHACTRLFSESPLMLDAFLGRHFTDEGVRLVSHLPLQILIGAETWKGNAYPATSGQGSSDIFAKWQFATDNLQLEAGGFGMKSEAVNRIDERYAAGHSHGGTSLVGPDVNFTGETTLYGLNGQLSWSFATESRLVIKGEWIQQKPEGSIQNSTVTRQTGFSATQSGGYAQLELRRHRHTIGIRQEALSVDNLLNGSGASILAQTASYLVSNNTQPQRLSLAYSYAFKPGIRLRLEWVQDESSSNSQNRVGVGVIWRETLWPRAE